MRTRIYHVSFEPRIAQIEFQFNFSQILHIASIGKLYSIKIVLYAVYAGHVLCCTCSCAFVFHLKELVNVIQSLEKSNRYR